MSPASCWSTVMSSTGGVHRNDIEFKGSEKCFPGAKRKAFLNMPFGEHGAVKIHTPSPHRHDPPHRLLIGPTGNGKITALGDHLGQMRERQDSAVMFDLTGTEC